MKSLYMVLLALLLLAIPRGFIASSWLHLPLGVEHSLPSSSARESSSFTNEFESKLDCNFRSGEYQYHGTTTLSFQFGDSVIVCVDSRASIGDYVGSRTVKKVFPVSDTAVATMAGGAADCAFWIRQISLRSKIFSYNYGDSLSVSSFAKLLSTTLRDYKGKGLSVGTMIAGLDGSGEPSIYYVDSEGTLLKGDKFCVGSGATLAYSIIDSMLPNVPSWDVDGAFAVALNAVSKATLRDGYSGGYVNLIHINASGVHHIKHIDSRMLHDQHTNIPL